MDVKRSGVSITQALFLLKVTQNKGAAERKTRTRLAREKRDSGPLLVLAPCAGLVRILCPNGVPQRWQRGLRARATSGVRGAALRRRGWHWDMP